MSIDFEELRAMVAAGATAALIVGHLERKENKRATKRERDKLRQRAIRSDIVATCGDVAAPIQDQVAAAQAPTSPSADAQTKQTPTPNVPPDPPKDITTTTATTREHAAEKMISSEAFALTERVMAVFGAKGGDDTPLEWYGAPYWFDAGLRGGWNPDVVVLAAKQVKARDAPLRSFRYLEGAIADMHRNVAKGPKQTEMFLHVVDGGHATNIQTGGFRARKGQGFAGRSRSSG